VLGCSVILTNSIGESTRWGLESECAHSVVLVCGYLNDPTAGQFRTHESTIPDYLVLPSEIPSPMIAGNRRAAAL
jgi:hypothetical protein